MPLPSRLAAASAVAWTYLVIGHGDFWLASPRLPDEPPEPSYWPSVGVLFPARNEAAVLPETLHPLPAQDYPGDLVVGLVDDGSGDGTGALARTLANRDGASLTVLTAPPPPPGWTGKLNADQFGVQSASAAGVAVLLVTPADSSHTDS